jgi:CBS domain containing-hemolysin-like protein
MSGLVTIGAIAVAGIGSLFFSVLSYSLRDLSRVRLEEFLGSRGKGKWLERTLDYSADLAFITAVWRLVFNLLILVGVLVLLEGIGNELIHYLLSIVVGLFLSLFCSVIIPHALAKYAGAAIIGRFVGLLHALRIAMLPITRIMHGIDQLAGMVAGESRLEDQEHINKEILSVVEEGEKEGVVDKQEREMIESVIEFRDTQVGQIMTARPDIVGLDVGASLAQVKGTIEETAHSRIPVYNGTMDQIVGIMYARDLVKHVGLPAEQFDIRAVMRPAIFVPETKPLRDLLREFRAAKVHIAIVLDEYGGTAGLVSIEDILEELVGEISDEHEAQQPAMLKKLDGGTWEADARVKIDELKRVVGVNLPEDAGYETLGGFLSTSLGEIPEAGTAYEHSGVRYTILEAEPQRVNRVRIETSGQVLTQGQ